MSKEYGWSESFGLLRDTMHSYSVADDCTCLGHFRKRIQAVVEYCKLEPVKYIRPLRLHYYANQHLNIHMLSH